MDGLGARIAQLRRQRGSLTQSRFAESLGAAFRVGSGGRGHTELERMGAIARALNTAISALMKGGSLPVPGQEGEKLYDEERMFTYVKAMALSHGLDQTCPLHGRSTRVSTGKEAGRCPASFIP